MIVDEVLAAVFPHLGSVVIDAVEVRGQLVRLTAHTRSVAVACASCGVLSKQVHGRYVRRLSDVAVGGCEVR